MIDFFLENWLSLTTLLIALLGGIPGIHAVVKSWREKPRMTAYAKNFSTFSVPEWESRACIVFVLIIGNKGKEPFIPLGFDLHIKKGLRWIKCGRIKLTDEQYRDLLGGNEEQLLESKYNLQEHRKPLTFDNPIHGYLCFYSEEISLLELSKKITKTSFRLTCTDLNQMKHKLILNRDLIVK